MSLRRLVWVTVGLIAWAGIVVLWATGPYDCQAPDANQHVSCRR